MWASPSVTNSRAVSMAPRTSSRSERLFWRRSVIEGNMCSQGYGWGRTEKGGGCGVSERTFRDPTAQSRTGPLGLQSILQGVENDDAGRGPRVAQSPFWEDHSPSLAS